MKKAADFSTFLNTWWISRFLQYGSRSNNKSKD